ncbi:MAG TPA: biotin/lipoyl-containing protein [Clostridia bacterium]
MRKFVINVNGNRYEVEVEEVGGSVNAVQPAAAPVQAAPAEPAQPVQKAEAPAAPKPAANSSAPAGAVKITAPMPGTILDIKVKTGDQVKKGDILLILEAMKMENEIVSPQDGVIASVNTSKGASVNSGDLLLSING